MKLLVGSTGLIGTTLKDGIKFDYTFNSKNLSDLLTLDIDTSRADLYLCCLPATKWLVNKDPQSDLENILKILKVLSKRQYRNIVLYSTIDVYNGHSSKADESSALNITTPSYGSNRLLFEKLIVNTLHYSKILILRLPALFGQHLKKNILFDLLTQHEVHKINYNSSYQWYNLQNLTADTQRHLGSMGEGLRLVNLFSEPVDTSDILDLFKVTKSEVNTTSARVDYDYTTNHNSTGYHKSKDMILSEIKDFIHASKISSVRMAICLFGEPRDVLDRIQDWKNFSSHVALDFYVAFYSNAGIHDTIQTLRTELPVRAYYITDNNLSYFDKLKYQSKQPIHLYGIDNKATFARITSQAYIRQKATSIVDLKDYDVVMLCRSDISRFQISILDIIKAWQDPNLLIVNSGTHIHPGGGSGCTQCTLETRCELPYHANDICDLWCMGSSQLMSKWNVFYDDILTNYQAIQNTISDPTNHPQIHPKYDLDNNEITLTPPVSNLHLIENDMHCYYPEKIIRAAFMDAKILGASPDITLWSI